jgi:hypothetical protein
MKRWLWGFRCVSSAAVLSCACLFANGQGAVVPKIFPEPREVEARRGRLTLEPSVPVLVPTEASREDLELGQLLVADLVDKHGLALKALQASKLPATGPPRRGRA